MSGINHSKRIHSSHKKIAGFERFVWVVNLTLTLNMQIYFGNSYKIREGLIKVNQVSLAIFLDFKIPESYFHARKIQI